MTDKAKTKDNDGAAAGLRPHGGGGSAVDVPFLDLKVHSEIDHQVRLAMDGIESSAVIGEKGTGKTEALRAICDRIEREEILKPSGDGGTVREIFRLVASDATGAKTLLIDLYYAMTQTKLTGAAARSTTPRDLAELIAVHCADKCIHGIVLDEAQKVNAHNLDQLREIPDRARDRDHHMGIVLVGNPGLRRTLAKTGELGQRIATVTVMPLLERAFIAEQLPTLHPDLRELREDLGKKGWAPLEERLVRKVDGKIRRLTTIIANAAVLSTRLKRPIDEIILRTAIDKLSPEV
jgi:DNA transposition AAA+ family ATPase